MKNYPVALAVIALMFVSCAPTPESVAKKISNGKELSSKDYSVILDYAYKSLSQIGDSIDKYEKLEDRRGLVTAMKCLAEEMPQSNVIYDCLLSTDPSSLSDENRELYAKIQKLQDVNMERFNNLMGFRNDMGQRLRSVDDESVATSDDEMKLANPDSISVEKFKPAE